MAFSVATKVVSGIGSAKHLPTEIEALRLTRVALVLDEGFAEAGLAEPVTAPIPDAVLACRLTVPADPSLDQLEQLLAPALSLGCDGVVVLGGGSAMAVGKAAGILLANDVALVDLEGLTRTQHRPKPVIAIPTTAGSGSEVSRVLVVHQKGRHTDLAIRIDGSQPAVAILDGSLMRTLPRTPMLFAALDALTHAFESLWAKGQSSFTRALAVQAAQTLFEVLPIALDSSPGERSCDRDDVLQRLIEASCAANMACGNSGMGLVHAFSSAPSIRLPHGLRNGVMLPHVAEFNRERMRSEDGELIDRIPALFDSIGFRPSFADYRLPATATKDMIIATVEHPFRTNNLREATDEQLIELLARADAPAGPDGVAA